MSGFHHFKVTTRTSAKARRWHLKTDSGGCFYDVGNHRPVVGFSSFQGHNQDVGNRTPTERHAIACGYAPGSFD
jgi:hypothetical protein